MLKGLFAGNGKGQPRLLLPLLDERDDRGGVLLAGLQVRVQARGNVVAAKDDAYLIQKDRVDFQELLRGVLDEINAGLLSPPPLRLPLPLRAEAILQHALPGPRPRLSQQSALAVEGRRRSGGHSATGTAQVAQALSDGPARFNR